MTEILKQVQDDGQSRLCKIRFVVMLNLFQHPKGKSVIGNEE